MSQRYIGSSISPTAAPTSSTSTTGVWSVNDQYQAKNAGNWPLYTPPATTDPYFQYVSMLLPGNGTNGAQNNTFLDSSTNNFTITRTGNTTQGTFTPYGANWSNYFDGTGDYLSISNNGGIIPSTSSTFTIEAWVYSTALQAEFATPRAPCMFGDMNGATNYMSFGPVNYAGVQYVGLYWVSGSSAGCYGTTTPLALNTWYHIAISVSANSIKLFVNGTLQTLSGTSTLTNRGGTSGAYAIGNYNSNTCAFTGYISNLRVVNGTALYSSSFTPSTTPIQPVTNTTLLTCQSNRLMDNSPNNFTITKNGDTSVQRFSPFEPATVTPYYSGYFDGSGDYLSFTGTAIGTNSYTVEFWFCINNFSTAYATYSTGNANGLNIRINNATTIAIDQQNVGQTTFTVPTMSVGTWNHVAVVRNSSNVCTVFLNGVRSSTGTATMTTNYSGISNYVGLIGANYFPGCISNLRVIVGSALYDPTLTTLTVPTAPLTAVSGTVLLTCQSSTFIDNSGNNLTITVNGNSQPLATAPFTPTVTSGVPYSAATIGGSAYFDGSGDYLDLPNNTVFSQTGIWTWECWVYPTAAQNNYLYGQATSNYLQINISASNYVIVDRSGVGALITSTNPIPLKAWTHLAMVSDGTNMKLFINGTQSGSTAGVGTQATSAAVTRIGAYQSTGTLPFAGYVSNMRLVKGTAVYTSAFSPPPEPVTAITNTQLLVNGTNAGIIDNAEISDLETVSNAQISTAQSKFGGSSMYFDGTNDSLTTPNSINLNFYAGDFTIECWAYFNNISSEMVLVSKGWQSANAYASYLIFMAAGGVLKFGASSNGGSWDISSDRVIATMVANTWTHIAITRSGTTFRAFIDGALISGFTFTSSSSLFAAATQALYVGGRVDGASSMNGYIDDLRFTKGYARYTTTFTPPTSAFPTA